MNRYVYKIAYVITNGKRDTFVSKKHTERKTLRKAIKFIRNLINNNNTKEVCDYIELWVLNKKSRKPVHLQCNWEELIAFSDSAIEAILKEVLRRYCE